MKTNTGFGVGLTLSFALAGLFLCAAEEPVAMVTDLKGAASLVEGGSRSSLAVLAYLAPGVEIQAEAGTRVVVTYLSEAREYSFNGPAKVAIGRNAAEVLQGKSGESRQLAESSTAAARKFAPLQRERMAMLSFEMRGPSQALRLLGPVNTQVLAECPGFSWTTLPGIARYRLVLMDDAGLTAHEAHVEGGYYRLPREAVLQRGRKYTWKVEGKPQSGKMISATGSFVILDAERASTILAARPGAEAPFSERVLYAVLLESEGLGFDARTEWRALARERPGDASLKRWAER